MSNGATGLNLKSKIAKNLVRVLKVLQNKGPFISGEGGVLSEYGIYSKQTLFYKNSPNRLSLDIILKIPLF